MRVGGRAFRVKPKGEDPALFNPEPCRPCHGEVTLERMVTGQEEVRILLESLADLLPEWRQGLGLASIEVDSSFDRGQTPVFERVGPQQPMVL